MAKKRGIYMQLFTLILKKEELCDKLMHELFEAGIKGGTLINGEGMAKALHNMDDIPTFGLLRRAWDESDRETVKTLLLVLKDEPVPIATKVVKDVIGDLNEPNTGIMFTMPVNIVEGFGGNA